jgi:tetratricopeptide (TPR) repeat protein
VATVVSAVHGQFRDITPRVPEQNPSTIGENNENEPSAPEPIPRDEPITPEKPAPLEELLPPAEHSNESSEIEIREAEMRDTKLARQMVERLEEELIDDTQSRPIKFRGILVGVSTADDVTRLWGQPFKIVSGETSRILKYRATPFRQVDVTVADDQVVSILIHLFDLQDPMHIANELRMTKIEPVPIPDDYGNVMGLAFPERGVLLGFDLRDPESLVSKIHLEAVNPEPFLLRAEYDFQHNYSKQLADIETALTMNPRYARAHWLKARLLSELGRYRDALDAVETAIEYDRDTVAFQVLRARLLEALGKLGPARRQIERIQDQENISAAVKAEMELLLGNLLIQEKPNQFNVAMRRHLKAIEMAVPLANDSRFEPRRSAKRTLIEAHLAVARDITLGNFQRQREVAPKWLRRAKALVEEFVERDQGDRALRLQVDCQMLAAASDLRSPDDPGSIVDGLFEEGRRLIAVAEDTHNKHRIEWILATALSEAVRLERLRGEHDAAIDAANDALSLFQESAPERQSTPAQKYVVGRLYFHIGSLHAIQRKDHDEAVGWYAKAEPMLTISRPSPWLVDARTHGESFISMGVSYWETDDREKALELTELGTDVLQRAVLGKDLESDVLAIPYGNLASMHKSAGNVKEAKAFAELAASLNPSADTLQR